jgi:hypothetical protein
VNPIAIFNQESGTIGNTQHIVLLPAFQVFSRKRAGSSFGQKGQFASYKEKLEKQNFTPFRVNKI